MRINFNHINRFIILVALFLFVFQSASAQNAAAPKAASSKRIIEQLFAAWNSKDSDKVAASFSEDAVYEDVPSGHISRGRVEVLKFVKETLAVVDNLKIEAVSISIHKGHGVVEWIWSGTDKGLLKTGKKFSVRGVSVFEVGKGRILRYKDYYDFATIKGQVELPPAGKE